ncbi:MAG: ThuA domain-containing protein [Verrucomicrobiota bacterium]
MIQRLLLLALVLMTTAGAKPIHALVLSGNNNHDWRTTTPYLVSELLESGEFIVTVVYNPEHLQGVDLGKVDVLVSDWNAIGLGDDAEWSEETQQAYVDFVKNGGGHVVVHAGSSSFIEWEDYQKICLSTWKEGQTGHGPHHEFKVKLEEHAITAGIEPFSIKDELWHKVEVAENATAIAFAWSGAEFGGTDKWEPVAFVGQFGKGRCYNITLGHHVAGENESLLNPNFVKLFLRGTEWAASGKVERFAN